MTLTLPIDKIDIRSQYQIRFHLDETRVNEYAELMREGVEFSPILVGEFVGYRGPDPDPTYFLLDGFHRIEAARRAGLSEIAVNVVQVSSQAEKIEQALRANIHHGLPLTAEERRRAVMFVISCYPKETLQRLAFRCGVSKSTVARCRDELYQMGKLKLNGTTTGEDGKQRKQKYDKRDEKPEIVKCPKCGKEELSTNLEKAGWVQNEKTGSWYCSEECRDWMAELMNEDNWEHQEHEPETGCDQKSQPLPEESQELPDSPSEPEPEPEPDQEPAPEPESRADAEPETTPLPEGKATYCAAGCGTPMWSCFQGTYVAHDGKWFCSEKCAQRYREKNPEPEPEPEPDPGTNPKMVRCAICSRKTTLEAATFHASSWIYDADSFDSEKMTWTRWFCDAHCEALRDDLLTINERLAEHLAEELVNHLYHDPFGYRDPENVQAILTRALELYREKAKGIIKK